MQYNAHQFNQSTPVNFLRHTCMYNY